MDFLKELGTMALGSRLKRLLERLNKDVARYYRRRGTDFQPHWFSTLVLLGRRSPMTITGIADELRYTHPAVNKLAGQMVQAGLVQSSPGVRDRRERHLSLTRKGRESIAILAPLWDDINAVMAEAIAESGYDLVKALDGLEDQLDRKSLFHRLTEDAPAPLPEEDEIIDYRPAYRKDFRALNFEWLKDSSGIEEQDRHMLSDPEGKIIKTGGAVFFARRKGKIVGTCALVKHPDGVWEMAKMAVAAPARRRHIGTELAMAAIRRARASGASKICLETSPKDARAIGFFKTLGFRKTRMARLPARYRRPRLTMELNLAIPQENPHDKR